MKALAKAMEFEVVSSGLVTRPQRGHLRHKPIAIPWKNVPAVGLLPVPAACPSATPAGLPPLLCLGLALWVQRIRAHHPPGAC